jgi:hypothetical protein
MQACPDWNLPLRPFGSPFRRGNRNHHTSIGAPKLLGLKPIDERNVADRPSHATVNAARISRVSPSAVRYRTPTTRPSRISGRSTSVLRISVNVGSTSAAVANSSRKSHCGTSAMCLWAPGSLRRFISTGTPWTCMWALATTRWGICSNRGPRPSSSSRRSVLACTGRHGSPAENRRACPSPSPERRPGRAAAPAPCPRARRRRSRNSWTRAPARGDSGTLASHGTGAYADRMSGLLSWWDGVELWLSGLGFVLQTLVVMPVVLALAGGLAVLLDGALGQGIRSLRRIRHGEPEQQE